MSDLTKKQITRTTNISNMNNMDDVEESKATFSDPSENKTQNTISTKQVNRKKRRWMTASFIMLLLFLFAAGYFFVFRPQMATLSVIRTEIETELGDGYSPVNLEKQIWREALLTWRTQSVDYIVTVSAPNYEMVTYRDIAESIVAPVFDVSVDEATYRSDLEKIVVSAAAEILQRDPHGKIEQQLTVHVQQKNGTLTASLDSNQVEEMRKDEDLLLQSIVDEIYANLPQSWQIDLVGRKEDIVSSLFESDYLVKNTQLVDIIELGNDSYKLVLLLPLPDGLAAYCENLNLESESSNLEVSITFKGNDPIISDVEKTNAVGKLNAYYSTIGEQLELAGNVKPASIAYALGGDYARSCAVYDWGNALQVSNYAIAAVKLDGTVLFHGNLYKYDHTTDTMLLYQPDLSKWSDIQSIVLTNLCVFGLRTDGTVKFEGTIWKYDSTIGSYITYQPDVSGWTDIKQIAVSDYGVAGLKSDGTVVSEGSYELGAYNTQVLPFDTAEWKNVKQIYASYHMLVGVCEDSSVVQTGSFRISPTKCVQFELEQLHNISDLAVNYSSMLALKSDGTVTAQGECFQIVGSSYGQMPMDTSSWTNVQDVMLTDNSAIGIRDDGSVIGIGNPTSMLDYPFNWSSLDDALSIEAGTMVVATDQKGGLIFAGDMLGIDSIDDDGLVASYSGNSYLSINSNLIGLSSSWQTLMKVRISEIGNVIAGLRSDGEVVWLGEIVSANKTILDLAYEPCDWKLW